LFSEKSIGWTNYPGTTWNLILDYVRPAIYSGKNQFLSFELSNELSEAIIKFTKTLTFQYICFFFSTKYIARRYTSNNDIVVGTPIYKTVSDGLINKVVPLQTNVKPQISFKDFLLQVKDTTIGAYSHQSLLMN